MAQRTRTERTMTRPELAAYLTEMADEFDRDSEDIRIDVGNKAIELQPTETVDLEIEVVERSSRLRGNRETIELQLSWRH